MNTTDARLVNDGTTRHPSSDLLGEEIYMCAECGAIDGHTAKCAIVRIPKATNVTPAPVLESAATIKAAR